MTEPRLVLPYDVEGVLIDVLDRCHGQHLAKLERQLGKGPRTFEPFATMVRMSDAAADRLSGDTVPALLLGVIGALQLRRNEDEGVDAVYQLGMQVTVMGARRREVILTRDAMAWTVVECLYQRTPRGRGSLLNSLVLVDYEPLSESDTQRTVGDARLVWEIGVANALSITGGLPPVDVEWPPEAGGEPPEPYDPVEPRPVADVEFSIDRQPLVE